MGWNPLESIKNLWKGVEDLGHKMGIDKDHWKSVVPTAVTLLTGNPTYGRITGGLMDGMDGVKNALVGEAITGLAGSSGLIDLKNSNSIPGFKETMGNVFKDPTKLLQNIILNGGDVKKGFLTSLLQTNPTLNKYSSLITGALGDITGIDLSKFGLKDATSLYAMVKYLKDSPPEPPEVTYQHMTPEVVDNLYNNYSDIMDEKNKVALQNVRDQFNARGMYRSGMELAQERKTQEDTNRALANYKANLDQQALQYNNELARQKYSDDLKNYDIQAKLDADKKDALLNLINSGTAEGGYLSNLLNKPGNENLQSQLPTILSSGEPSINVDNRWVDDVTNDINGTIPSTPDINLNDQINTNQDNYIDDLTFNSNLSPLRQNMVQQNRAPQNSPIENNGSGNNLFRNSMTSQRFSDEQAKYNKEMQDNQNKYRQSLLNKYKEQWKPGTVLPVGFTNGRDMNGKGTFYYIDKNGNMQGIDNGGFMSNDNKFNDQFKNIFGYDYSTYNKNKLYNEYMEKYKDKTPQQIDTSTPQGIINSTIVNGGNLRNLLNFNNRQNNSGSVNDTTKIGHFKLPRNKFETTNDSGQSNSPSVNNDWLKAYYKRKVY